MFVTVRSGIWGRLKVTKLQFTPCIPRAWIITAVVPILIAVMATCSPGVDEIEGEGVPSQPSAAETVDTEDTIDAQLRDLNPFSEPILAKVSDDASQSSECASDLYQAVPIPIAFPEPVASFIPTEIPDPLTACPIPKAPGETRTVYGYSIKPQSPDGVPTTVYSYDPSVLDEARKFGVPASDFVVFIVKGPRRP